MVNSEWLVATHLLVQVSIILRVLQRPHREPASRLAWLVVVLLVPVLGIFAYVMLGETNIGRRNQKAVLRNRAALVDDLYSTPPPAQVIVSRGQTP